MQLQITGRHVEVTDAIREFIENKFAKLERHFDQITQAHVILSVEKNIHQAEAKVNISGGEIFAHNEADNMYASIDLLIDKLDRQLIKHKEKLKDHQADRPNFESEEPEAGE